MAEAAFKLTALAPSCTSRTCRWRSPITATSSALRSRSAPPRYVCLRLDDVSIHLNSYVPPAGPSHVAIFCKGVDALYEQFAARGVAITEPITNEPYGMREFVVTDPDGHRLVFGQGTGEH